ncbi:hypothetical protein [Carboxylicivirga marina]|uniref:Uncharacterized protein n=1 Tax=Carboxylicivirga marina TaxID=2800988 RepID=A0ABS1HK58_9BACT|nr:hypothetical protein [Carboxylicivirga marina]MBK3517663.1 hypothetical protein [Carboxylicivirga marina]
MHWIICLFLITPFIGYECFSQSIKEKGSINGYFDHVVVTMPTKTFDSLSLYLKGAIPNSTRIAQDNSKVFILPRLKMPYVEIWNSGIIYNAGNQIALGSTDDNAIEKAKAHYMQGGFDYGDGLFIVGRELAAGHPYGGNFFVSYGNLNTQNQADSIEILRLKEIKTIIPKTREYIQEDYEFFNIEIEKQDSTFSSIDKYDTKVYTKIIKGTPEKILLGKIGHVSFRFELTEAKFNEYKEILVDDKLKIIFDGKELIIILLEEEYIKW